MVLALYAKLVAFVDGATLLEQTGIAIHDAVNKPCRVTIDMAMPESGPEFDGRKRLGDVVRVSVHIMRHHMREVSDPIVEMTGKVVEAKTVQRPEGMVCHTITVEHCEPAPLVDTADVHSQIRDAIDR